MRYVDATADEDFERGPGMELLIETARLWRSLGHHDAQGAFHIDGVTGPDEYSAVADDNVYTNLMARQNLLAAADVVNRHPDRARQLGIDQEESASWRDAAHAMHVPFDDVLGVHAQAQRFTEHQAWDFASTRPEQYPLLLHFPYFDLYRKQVVKQADLVLAMYLRGAAFTAEQKERNFTYYEALTVRDSSLSACIQAVMAAETGHLSLAYDYLGEAALMDLRDLERRHPRRRAHRLARRRLDRPGRRVRRDADASRRHQLRSTAARGPHEAGVLAADQGQAAARRDHGSLRHVLADRRRPDPDPAPRRTGPAHGGARPGPPDSGGPARERPSQPPGREPARRRPDPGPAERPRQG